VETHYHQEAPLPSVGPALKQLPSAPDLVGRDAELTDLEQLLANAPAAAGAIGSGKGAVLHGMGGVGKTALALALARRLGNRYPDAQLLIHLHGAEPESRQPVTPADALQTVIHAFHPEARLPEEIEPLQALYRSVLQDAGRRCLLLLDDAANADQVHPLLPPPNCLLLVTSRQQFTLPGLLARPLGLLAPDKSVELLLRLAKRLDGQTAVDAAALCGNLPLALEVVAGLVNENPLLSVHELLDRIRAKKVTLASVDAAFAVSCDVLDPAQRRRWCLLSVFSGSFDLAAAVAVWSSGGLDSMRESGGEAPAATGDDALDAMQALVKASLVEWDTVNQRLRLHDLAQDFAARQVKQEDTYAARLRHAEHFTQVAARADNLYQAGGEKVVEGLALFDRERLNFEAAFEFLSAWNRRHGEAGASGRGVHAAWTPAGLDTLKQAEARAPKPNHIALRLLVRLVNALVYISSVRFRPRELVRWQEGYLAAAREIGDRTGEGGALGNLGNAYFNLGDARKAIEFYEQSLVFVREIGNRQQEGNALGNLGNAYAALGEARKAIEFHEKTLVIMREIGDRRGEGSALGNLGNDYYEMGDARKAIEYHEQRLAIAREIGDRQGEGTALGNLGNAYLKLGDARKAIEFYEQSLVFAREIGDREGEGTALGHLGGAYFNLGDFRKAIEFSEQDLPIAREIEDRRGEGSALGNLGNAHRSLGDARKAIEFHEQQLAISREIGARRDEGFALVNLGIDHRDLRDASRAIEFYEQALVIVREIGDRRREGGALGNLGNAHRDLGDARKAIEFYEQWLTIAREVGDRGGEGNALWNSAVAEETLGRRPEAIVRAEAALKVYEEIKSPAVAKVRARVAAWRGST
jgi:FOG: TPR repeat